MIYKKVMKILCREASTNLKRLSYLYLTRAVDFTVGTVSGIIIRLPFPFLFRRYGEVVNIKMIRDEKSGRFKGFGFLCYQDQRSTILAVDNLNGIKVREMNMAAKETYVASVAS